MVYFYRLNFSIYSGKSRFGFDLLLRADDGLRLDAGDILGVSPGQEAVVVLGQRD